MTGLDPVTIAHAFVMRRGVVEEDLYQNDDLVRPYRKMQFFSFWAEKAGA